MATSKASIMIKRILHVGEVYVITAAQAHLPIRIGDRLRIVAQYPDNHLPLRLLSVCGTMLSGSSTGFNLNLDGIGLRRYTDGRPVCNCSAYHWPHHLGKGKCAQGTLDEEEPEE